MEKVGDIRGDKVDRRSMSWATQKRRDGGRKTAVGDNDQTGEEERREK